MESSQPNEEFPAGEGNDFPVREKVSENRLRFSIIGNVEYRKENGPVADIKVGIARRESG